MYLTKLKVCVFSFEWIPLPCSVCASTLNSRTDKWRYLKSLLKMTWLIFHLISPQQNYDTGALSLFCFVVAQSVLWSHFAFIVALLTLVSALVFFFVSGSASTSCFHPRPWVRAGEVIVDSECIELYGNRAEKRARSVVMILMRHGGSRLTSPNGGLQTFIIPNTRWLKGWGWEWYSDLPSIGSNITLQVSQRIKLERGEERRGKRSKDKKKTQ